MIFFGRSRDLWQQLLQPVPTENPSQNLARWTDQWRASRDAGAALWCCACSKLGPRGLIGDFEVRAIGCGMAMVSVHRCPTSMPCSCHVLKSADSRFAQLDLEESET
jgi:hypothetical protein